MKTLYRIAKEAKKYRVLLIIAALSTLSITGLNLLAPRLLSNMVGIVSDMAASDTIVSDGIASDTTVSYTAAEESLSRIGAIALWLTGIYLARILFRFLSNYLAHKAAWNLVHEIRLKVYNTIQSFSMDFFHNKQTGELMSRVTNDTAMFEQLYAHIIPDMMTNFFTLAGVTVILFGINPRLALLTCIPIPFILLSGWFFAKKVRPKFRKMIKAQGEMTAQLQDNLSGIKEIQSFGQQERATEKFGDRNWEYTDTMLKALKASAVFHPGVEFLTALGSVIVVGLGGYLAFQAQLSVADIVAFLLYLALFYAPIQADWQAP